MANISKIPNLHKDNPLHRKAEHASGAAKPMTANGAIASRTLDPRINIQIMKRPDNTHYARFKVYSHVKPDMLVQYDFELRVGASEREMGFQTGVVCGAMAERLNELHGDNIDPERCAREGSAKFQKLLDAWGSEKKS